MFGLGKHPDGLGRWGQYYVYFLRYPDDPFNYGKLAGTVFYVGKGKGNRVNAHEAVTKAILKRNRLGLLRHKNKVIIQIWDSGDQVVQEILGRTDDETLAYDVESYYIHYFGMEKLTNIAYPHKPKSKIKTPRRVR